MMNAQQENMAATIIVSTSRMVVTAVCVTMVTPSHQMADTVKMLTNAVRTGMDVSNIVLIIMAAIFAIAGVDLC